MITPKKKLPQTIESNNKHKTNDYTYYDLDMDRIEAAIIRHAKHSWVGGDRGIPIHEIINLINRLDEIKLTLEQYRDWRIHRGA